MEKRIDSVKLEIIKLEKELKEFEMIEVSGNRNDELTSEYLSDEISELKIELENLEGENAYNKHIDSMRKMGRDMQRWAIEDRAREIEILGR